jgi:hypothetical protein
MKSTVEQIVRHVAKLEQNDLAKQLDAELAQQHNTRLTARVLFIHLLGWIRTRGTTGRATTLQLSDCPWAAKLRALIQSDPEFSALFHIQGDQLDFNPALAPDVIRWAEAYVAENYRPVAML